MSLFKPVLKKDVGELDVLPIIEGQYIVLESGAVYVDAGPLKRVKITGKNTAGLAKITPVAATLGVAQIDPGINDSSIYLVAGITTATTISLTPYKIPEDSVKTIEIHIQMPSALQGITFNWTIAWIDGTAPVFTARKTNVIVLRTADSGATWTGNLAYIY